MTLATAKRDSEPRPKKADAIRPLDLFLLGLVRGGLVTPYDWKSRARTSLGASLPAVRRLLDAGLLKKAAKGPRGRHEFALTAKGEDAVRNLARYVEGALDQSPGDLESVVRLACLATIIGDTGTAKKLLVEATNAHRQRARSAKRRPAGTTPLRSRLGALYSTVLADCEAAEEAATAEKLESLRRRWDKVAEEVLQQWRDERRTRR